MVISLKSSETQLGMEQTDQQKYAKPSHYMWLDALQYLCEKFNCVLSTHSHTIFNAYIQILI